MGNIFETRFSEVKRNLEEKIKKITGYSLGLKRKRKSEETQSQGKRREVKEIFTEEEK